MFDTSAFSCNATVQLLTQLTAHSTSACFSAAHWLFMRCFRRRKSSYDRLATKAHSRRCNSSVATGARAQDPALAVLGHRIRARVFWGEGRWRTDSATNLRRRAFDSCKLVSWPPVPHQGSAPGPRLGNFVPRWGTSLCPP